MDEPALHRVRSIAMAFPGVTQRVSHGEPCVFIRDKRPLCYFHHDHNGDARISLWCPAPPGVQEELVAAEPERFIRPQPSVGGVFAHLLGMYLDTTGQDAVDWDEIAAILEGSYRLVAPKTLIAELDDRH